ncbi:MAG: DUF2004 domain-containing protein [Corynebacterium sp.]|nr:DUF2004 domain-containing protein [Corynebacterium sp.]
MSVFKLPIFGDVVLGESYEINTRINNQEVPVSLCLEDAETMEEVLPALHALSSFLPNLHTHVDTAYQAIFQAFNEDQEWTSAYIQFHLGQLTPEQIINIVGTDPTTATAQQLAQNLELLSIWSSPSADETEIIASFDFTIGQEYTNYVLSVGFAHDHSVSAIDMES